MARFVVTELKLLTLVLAAPIALAGCRAEGPAESGDSPEAVYRAMCEAGEAKDWEKMAGCFSPESRDALAGMLMMMGAFMTMNEEQGPAVIEIFKRHGIEGLDEEADEERAFGDVTEPLSIDVRLSYETPFFMMHEPTDLPDSEEEPLFATLMLDGKPVAEASRVGFLQVDAARDDKGQQLAALKAKCEQLDVDGEFADASGGMLIKDATLPMEIGLMLEGPSAEATSLAVLEGSLKLLTGGATEEVLIANIRSVKPEIAIENEVLKAAGVTVKLPYAMAEDAVSIAAEGPIWSMDLADGKGKKMDTECVSGMGEFWFQSETSLPDDVGLRLVVLTGQKPLAVPFKFEDVPLPGEGEGPPEEEGDLFEGGPSEDDLKEMARPIKDKVAFIAEMFALMDRTGSLEDGPPGVGGGDLADVMIEGDTATAVQVIDQDGQEHREPIEFRRIDGRWFVHLPEDDS